MSAVASLFAKRWDRQTWYKERLNVLGVVAYFGATRERRCMRIQKEGWLSEESIYGERVAIVVFVCLKKDVGKKFKDCLFMKNS